MELHGVISVGVLSSTCLLSLRVPWSNRNQTEEKWSLCATRNHTEVLTLENKIQLSFPIYHLFKTHTHINQYTLTKPREQKRTFFSHSEYHKGIDRGALKRVLSDWTERGWVQHCWRTLACGHAGPPECLTAFLAPTLEGSELHQACISPNRDACWLSSNHRQRQARQTCWREPVPSTPTHRPFERSWKATLEEIKSKNWKIFKSSICISPKAWLSWMPAQLLPTQRCAAWLLTCVRKDTPKKGSQTNRQELS